MHKPETDDNAPQPIIEQAHALISKHRNQCLWFLRSDYLPSDIQGILRALRYIEQNGTLDAYIQARKLERCLLQNTSGMSAAS